MPKAGIRWATTGDREQQSAIRNPCPVNWICDPFTYVRWLDSDGHRLTVIGHRTVNDEA
ncbi:MAG: hypothetical protein ACE5K9_03990 [Candidatus Methylomirabilales bacterium]